MINLTDLILEAKGRPKVIVMAGGAAAGKSSLLDKLNLGSLPIVNPDKYVEDPNHQAYNNLSRAAALADKEAEDLSTTKQSFVWDTTASNPTKVKELITKGYDVYMVMVYTHPMNAFVGNFKRERRVPEAAVFSTWRNVYQLIKDYNKMTGGQFSLYINDRKGKYAAEVEAFDTAAKNGAKGISDFLKRWVSSKNPDDDGSTFRKPLEMSQEEENEFFKATQGIDWDKGNYSEDRAIKKAFLDAFQKNGVGPGADKLKDAVKKYRDLKAKNDQKQEEVLENIAEMLFSPEFQEQLKHSSAQEIDKALQDFLA